MAGIELSEVVKNLRQELRRAVSAGDGQDLKFEVEDLELELQVGVEKAVGGEGSAGGGLKFWVFETNASGKASASYASSHLQKIKLKLRPHRKHDDGTEEPLMLGGLRG